MGMVQDAGETIVRGFHRNMHMLGAGLFAEVFDVGDGTVVKVCRSIDGTYWWLKYAQALTLAGVRRDLVPEVYELVTVDYRGSTGYMAVMRKYHCAKECIRDAGESQFTCEDWLPGWGEAQGLFDKWCGAMGMVYKIRVNDLHSGNIMMDDYGNWVVTDPSSADVRSSIWNYPNFELGCNEH
jgi:hypothetical protein